MTKTHKLKTVQPHFDDLWEGRKTFELRQDDRGFKVGDNLVLRELKGSISRINRQILARVTHMLRGPVYGLAEGWVIMSIKIINMTTFGNLPRSHTHYCHLCDEYLLCDGDPYDCMGYDIVEGGRATECAKHRRTEP